MGTYRADPVHGVAWLTGGSTGIGRAVAVQLASEGYTVAVTARPEESIESLIGETASMQGRVLSFPCDVTDEAGMAVVVASIERDVGPIVLAIFNAGRYLATAGENLNVDNFRQTYAVNVFGVINGMVPVVERMRYRSRGHIVLIGSVAAYFGWPTTAAYGATKAALNNMAEALKYDFDKMNIRIQVMNPGFVDTPLTAKNPLKMYALMTVDQASTRICRAIRTGGFEVAFPRRLAWGLKLLRVMPRGFTEFVIDAATLWKARPLFLDRSKPQDQHMRPKDENRETKKTLRKQKDKGKI